MRKFNAVLTAAIMALFLLHGTLGSFQLFGWGTVTNKALTHGLLTLVAIHAIIGLKFTWDSARVWRRTGAPYIRQNALFWARRASGLAVMILLAFHLTAFSYSADGAFRLHWFNAAKLTTQLLLAVSLAVHIISNVKPALIAFGVRRLKPRAGDILLTLSLLLLVFTAAFIVYYFRWNAA